MEGAPSERARALHADWRVLEVLGLEDEASAPMRARPIGEVAAERIRKVHRRMVKMGRAITADSRAGGVPRAAQEGQGAPLPAGAVRGAALRR